MNGTRTVRFCTRKMPRTFCSALADGYQPFVFVSLSSRNAGLACRTSGGKSGQTGGPPGLCCKMPATDSSASRSCSAVRRRGRGVISESVISGPARVATFLRAASGADSLIADLLDDCRYAALITNSRCSFFMDQPLRTNSVASQSSNSGFAGRVPARPKSFGVATRPWPKCDCQTRFTSTRAVSGFDGEAIHSASVTRRPVDFVLAALRMAAGFGSNAERKPGSTGSRGSLWLPWNRTWVTGGGPSASVISHPSVKSRRSFFSAAISLPRWSLRSFSPPWSAVFTSWSEGSIFFVTPSILPGSSPACLFLGRSSRAFSSGVSFAAR